MSEAKYGKAFIQHEFDEAISIQSMLVETARSLAKSHPEPSTRALIKGALPTDERHLADLRRFGKAYGATGKAEEVAQALGSLARETAGKASDAESEAYEAHAVLLTLRRKQQDSAAAVLKIARATKETELRDAVRDMLRQAKAAAQELADALADFAVVIATRPAKGAGSRA